MSSMHVGASKGSRPQHLPPEVRGASRDRWATRGEWGHQKQVGGARGKWGHARKVAAAPVTGAHEPSQVKSSQVK